MAILPFLLNISITQYINVCLYIVYINFRQNVSKKNIFAISEKNSRDCSLHTQRLTQMKPLSWIFCSTLMYILYFILYFFYAYLYALKFLVSFHVIILKNLHFNFWSFAVLIKFYLGTAPSSRMSPAFTWRQTKSNPGRHIRVIPGSKIQPSTDFRKDWICKATPIKHDSCSVSVYVA